jgi:hypothetical protein
VSPQRFCTQAQGSWTDFAWTAFAWPPAATQGARDDPGLAPRVPVHARRGDGANKALALAQRPAHTRVWWGGEEGVGLGFGL